MPFKNIIFSLTAISLSFVQSTFAMQNQKLANKREQMQQRLRDRQAPQQQTIPVTPINQQLPKQRVDQQDINLGLMQASLYGIANLANAFIKSGANVNYKDENNESPLHCAASGTYNISESSPDANKHSDVIKLLLEHQANVNAKTITGRTPLHVGSQENQLEAIKLLLAAGADKNAQDIQGVTPLYIGCQNNYSDIVTLLCNCGADTNIATMDKSTPLHAACQYGFLEIAKILLAHGANVEAQTLTKWTPLYFACSYNHPNLVVLLINYKANLEAKNEYQMTPLFMAISNGYLDIINILLTNQANINALDKRKATPLHYAVINNQYEAIEILCKHGADLNAETVEGLTPIHFAYDKEDPDTINLLIKYGAHEISDKQAEEDKQEFFAELNQEEPQISATPIVSNKKKKQQKGRTPPVLTVKISEEEIPTEKPTVILEEQPLVEPEQPEVQKTEIQETEKVALASNPTPKLTSTPTPKLSNTTIKRTQKLSQQKNYSPTAKTIAPAKSSSSANISNVYQILMDKKFKWGKFLSKKQQGAIKDRLRQLKNWPLPPDLDIKALQGEEKGTFRMRVGGCRVVFFVDKKNSEITILEITLRGDAYKK